MDTQLKTNRFFVYGSLKKNLHNHRVMEWAGGEFIGEATITGATMYSMGGFPGLVLDDNTNPIYGEVYEIKDVKPLDRLEGAPDFYNRKVVESSLGPVYIYYLNDGCPRGCPIVESGKWE